MTDRYEETIDALAHEIWAVAQLAPGEGIVDGVDRIVSLLRREGYPAITHCDGCGYDWLDNGLNPVGCPYCKQTASVDEVKEPDLWRCTVCGRVGTVGRCCGEETREPVNEEVDTCDHSVGVCMCGYWNMRRKMKSALEKENSNE